MCFREPSLIENMSFSILSSFRVVLDHAGQATATSSMNINLIIIVLNATVKSVETVSYRHEITRFKYN